MRCTIAISRGTYFLICLYMDMLAMDITELRPWNPPPGDVVHLFCDASGCPPCLGAVLFCDGAWRWTCMDLLDRDLHLFKPRRDAQIIGLELLAISLGMCSFETWLQGRKIIVHCDNKGSEASIRRGSARSWDHAQLVHAQWLHAARYQMSLFIKRVNSKDNIGDLPSRGDFNLMHALGAEWVQPKLWSMFRDQDTWAVLQERWAAAGG